MTYPMGYDGRGDLGEPAGYTYSAVVVRVVPGDVGDGRDRIVRQLATLRFSGWVAPEQDGWVTAIPQAGDGVAAAGRRGVVEVAEALAAAEPGPVLALRVVEDRQLLIVGWAWGRELGRYLSDPSYGLADEEVLADALGVDLAEGLAAACGRPDSADALAELLEEDVDHESMLESERLRSVLGLLGLPGWIVASGALPRRIPTGPSGRQLVRLRAGRRGPVGVVAGRAAETVRSRRTPPPALTDVPRLEVPDDDPWMY